MTNAEKFLLNEKDAKLTVTAILKIFDGKSGTEGRGGEKLRRRRIDADFSE